MGEKLTDEERDELAALARFNAALRGPIFTDRSNWHGALGRLARRKLLTWGNPPSGFTKSKFAGIEITPAGRAALSSEDKP